MGDMANGVVETCFDFSEICISEEAHLDRLPDELKKLGEQEKANVVDAKGLSEGTKKRLELLEERNEKADDMQYVSNMGDMAIGVVETCFNSSEICVSKEAHLHRLPEELEKLGEQEKAKVVDAKRILEGTKQRLELLEGRNEKADDMQCISNMGDMGNGVVKTCFNFSEICVSKEAHLHWLPDKLVKLEELEKANVVDVKGLSEGTKQRLELLEERNEKADDMRYVSNMGDMAIGVVETCFNSSEICASEEAHLHWLPEELEKLGEQEKAKVVDAKGISEGTKQRLELLEGRNEKADDMRCISNMGDMGTGVVKTFFNFSEICVSEEAHVHWLPDKLEKLEEQEKANVVDAKGFSEGTKQILELLEERNEKADDMLYISNMGDMANGVVETCFNFSEICVSEVAHPHRLRDELVKLGEQEKPKVVDARGLSDRTKQRLELLEERNEKADDMRVVDELETAKREFEMLRQEFSIVLKEKCDAERWGEEAMATLEVSKRRVEELSVDLLGVNGSLVLAKLACMEASKERATLLALPTESLQSRALLKLDLAKLEHGNKDKATVDSIVRLLEEARAKVRTVREERESVQLELEKVREEVKVVGENEANAREAVAILAEELTSVKAEVAAADVAEAKAKESILSLSRALREVLLEVESDKSEVESLHEEAKMTAFEAMRARASLSSVEGDLGCALEEAKLAKEAEMKAFQWVKSLSEKTHTMRASGIQGIVLSKEEYVGLQNKGRAAEHVASMKSVAVDAQVQAVKASEAEIRQKLQLLNIDIDELRAATEQALRKVEMAEAARTAVEGELRRRRQNEKKIQEREARRVLESEGRESPLLNANASPFNRRVKLNKLAMKATKKRKSIVSLISYFMKRKQSAKQ